MNGLDERFGELRSVMQQGPCGELEDWGEQVRVLVLWALHEDEQAYLEQWVSYMRGFDHWAGPLWGLESMEELEVWATHLPFARFALDLSQESRSSGREGAGSESLSVESDSLDSVEQWDRKRGSCGAGSESASVESDSVGSEL